MQLNMHVSTSLANGKKQFMQHWFRVQFELSTLVYHYAMNIFETEFKQL